MNKLNLLSTYALFLLPALPAQSPFDGAWRLNDAQTKFSPKPYMASVNKGMYDCSSCRPEIRVQADGADQPFTGPFFDSISVREVDPKTIVVIAKKAGKVVSEQTRTVSDDGNSMTSKNTFYPAENGQVEHSEITYVRLGSAPAGANGTSGSWRMDKYKVSDDVHTVSYKSSGDEFSMSDPTGVSYTAKLDGKDYPVKGDYSCNSVSLKRIDERTIEETEKLDGKAVDVTKLTVSADGKTMTQVSTVKATGRTSTFIYDKQ